MFLRFSKSSFSKDVAHEYRKCVFLEDSVVMEYGNKIVGIAKLHEEPEKYFDYDVIVAGRNKLSAKRIARFIKDMIGKSNKFSDNPSEKRRKYYVEEIDAEYLPINAEIVFTKA